MLKTNIVDGLIGTPKNPIKPAVTNSGSILGINEINIISKERNIQAIKREIKRMARDNETTKFRMR